jgi:DNA-binding NtrC family response regulator
VARDQSDAAAEGWRGTGTILVIDDDALTRSEVARSVQILGFQVQLAGTGSEAAKVLRLGPQRFVAVLLDLSTGTVSAAETVQVFGQIAPNIPILLMSGQPKAVALAELGGAEVRGFVQKPFELGEIRDVLRATLDQPLIS